MGSSAAARHHLCREGPGAKALFGTPLYGGILLNKVLIYLKL
jgi:hypothetical protein